MRWYRDQNLWAAVAVGFVLRVLPMALWPFDSCVRDECTYAKLAGRFASGQGMTTSIGWLWAPGYPAYLGAHRAVFGWASAGKGLQIVAAAGATVLVYLLARRTFARRGDAIPDVAAGRRAGLIAAWLYATSAHMAFFAGRLWSEVLYGAILLGGLLLFAEARDALSARFSRFAGDDGLARKRAVQFATLVGVTVGVCVLFRGVAQYMLPIFIAGFLWGRLRQGTAWMQSLVLVAATVLVAAPYSIHATQKFDTFVLSDKTMGRMMWLGNNDFQPITFDYGNGQLSRTAYARTGLAGRGPCAPKADAMALDACSTEQSVEWIKDNPEEFVRRMPVRVAQMLNPHSLLTRHLRWGKFKGMPQWMDELIVLWQAAGSVGVMLLGMMGLVSRGKGAQGSVIFGILLYHVAAISLLAGLSRYRVPLEPLLMIYAGGLLAHPKATWAEVRSSPGWWRLWATGLVTAILIPLILWYLPAGWPTWRTW